MVNILEDVQQIFNSSPKPPFPKTPEKGDAVEVFLYFTCAEPQSVSVTLAAASTASSKVF